MTTAYASAEHAVQISETGQCCIHVQQEVAGEEHEGDRIQWQPKEGWKYRCIDPENLS